jgi:F-type H+-transporting ATPase subunit b
VQTTAAAISKANDEAVRMVTEAKQGAATFTEQKAQEAISSAQQILARAEAAAKAEHERLTAELKREFGRLVIATTSQVTGKVLTGDDQRRINEDALATVEA